MIWKWNYEHTNISVGQYNKHLGKVCKETLQKNKSPITYIIL
jgi:hypothetical protein